ncbi:SH3 domain-containing protein [Streptomyces sp. NPDC057137]|uniref:SH3 domain-containing protein n=1 Tax=Streptomyces sp. NPDC057137 TaxID=3346030 RepID=UPI003638B547
MRAPHTGYRITSLLAGVVLAGTALAVPAVAAGHPAGPAPFVTAEGVQAPAVVVPKGRVIAKPSLNVRKHPNTSSKPVRSIPYGTIINLDCKVNGEVVEGNPRWYLLKDGSGYVSARWVENANGVIPPWC